MYDDERISEFIKSSVLNQDTDENILAKVEGILESEPDNLDFLKYKVSLLFRLNRIEDCITACDKVLLIDSEDVDILEFKAHSLLSLEEYKECRVLCERILAINPSSQDTVSLLDLLDTLERTDNFINDIHKNDAYINDLCRQADKNWNIVLVVLIVSAVFYGFYLYMKYTGG